MADVYLDANFLIYVTQASNSANSAGNYLDFLTRNSSSTIKITDTVHREVMDNLSGTDRDTYSQWYFTYRNIGFQTALTPQEPGENRGEESIVWSVNGLPSGETVVVFSSDNGNDALALWQTSNSPLQVQDSVGAAAYLLFTGAITLNEYNSLTNSFEGIVPAQDFLADDPALAGLPKFVPGATYVFNGQEFKFLPGAILFIETTPNGTERILGVVGPDQIFDTSATDFLDALNQCFLAETPITLWDGSTKEIKSIEVGDLVLSYADDGTLVPGRVVRTFTNEVRLVFDVFGLKVTPGHSTLCGEGLFAGKHVPIIDILRTDGALVKEDGTLVRACTGCTVGSYEDQHVWLAVGSIKGGEIIQHKVRIGSRFILDDGKDLSVSDILGHLDAKVNDDGFVMVEGSDPMPLHLDFLNYLPQPEDYVLQRSGVALEDIYRANEWEAARPQLQAPAILDGGLAKPESRS